MASISDDNTMAIIMYLLRTITHMTMSLLGQLLQLCCKDAHAAHAIPCSYPDKEWALPKYQSVHSYCWTIWWCHYLTSHCTKKLAIAVSLVMGPITQSFYHFTQCHPLHGLMKYG